MSVSPRTKSQLLLACFAVCAGAVVETHHARMRTPPPSPRELFAAVSDEVSAMRQANFATAYRHAASGVQQKFTMPQFERMIRERYVSVMRNGRIEFGDVLVDGATAEVHVNFIAQSGLTQSFTYTLVAENGGWKIDSVAPARNASRAPNGIRL